MADRNEKAVSLYFDGASKGNPGPAGAGAVLMSNSHVRREIKKFLGKATNNQAEYNALLLGLEAARKMGATEVNVYGDSELVVFQLLGRYQVRDEKLKELYDQVVEVARSFDVIRYQHVPREQNKLADSLANQAVKEADATNGGHASESYQPPDSQDVLIELRIESGLLLSPVKNFIRETLNSLGLSEKSEPALSIMEALDRAGREVGPGGTGLHIRFFCDHEVAVMEVEMEERKPLIYQHFKIPR